MAKHTVHKTAPRPRAGHGAGRGAILPGWAPATVWAFGCGAGAAILLLTVFALLCERFALPVVLVRPLALAAVWCGAAVSGYVLAGRLGRQKLLCGLGCGIFYCLCLVLASVIVTGGLYLHADDAALPIALLLGGLVGGTVNALRAPSGTPLP